VITRAQLTDDPLRLALAAIAAMTALSGAGQLLLPGTVLDILGAESTPTSRHFFAIVGMFMVVIGGLSLQALLEPIVPPYVMLWAGLQKLGAFAAVAAAVSRDLFGGVALVVAVFDLATAVLFAMLWTRLRRPAGVRVVEPA
jgi:hypothetical protein